MKSRKKKRRQRKLILTLILLIIAIILIILLIRTVKKSDSKSNTSGESSMESLSSTETTEISDTLSGTEESENSDVKEMLTLTDEEVHTGDLILVNSEHAYDFDANESTIDLVNIRDTQSFYYQVSHTDIMLANRIMSSLDDMISDCDEAMGTSYTGVSSAYRSKEYQQNVWDEIEETYGDDYTKSHVAVPGYSEHHTGLSLDMGIFYEDGSEDSFSESENAQWMKENSWQYGFVRRYAEDKVDITGIGNEAWHFRYVGVPHAYYMYKNNLCLEEYLEYLEDNTSTENPLNVQVDDQSWNIWYTSDKEIEKPEGDYTISGNNTDGYIITEVIS